MTAHDKAAQAARTAKFDRLIIILESLHDEPAMRESLREKRDSALGEAKTLLGELRAALLQ